MLSLDEIVQCSTKANDALSRYWRTNTPATGTETIIRILLLIVDVVVHIALKLEDR